MHYFADRLSQLEARLQEIHALREAELRPPLEQRRHRVLLLLEFERQKLSARLDEVKAAVAAIEAAPPRDSL